MDMNFASQILGMHRFFVQYLGPSWAKTLEIGLLVVVLLILAMFFMDMMKK